MCWQFLLSIFYRGVNGTYISNLINHILYRSCLVYLTLYCSGLQFSVNNICTYNSESFMIADKYIYTSFYNIDLWFLCPFNLAYLLICITKIHYSPNVFL